MHTLHSRSPLLPKGHGEGRQIPEKSEAVEVFSSSSHQHSRSLDILCKFSYVFFICGVIKTH